MKKITVIYNDYTIPRLVITCDDFTEDDSWLRIFVDDKYNHDLFHIGDQILIPIHAIHMVKVTNVQDETDQD